MVNCVEKWIDYRRLSIVFEAWRVGFFLLFFRKDSL